MACSREAHSQVVNTHRTGAGAVGKNLGGRIIRYGIFNRRHSGLHTVHLGTGVGVVGVGRAKTGVLVVVAHRYHEHAITLLDAPCEGNILQLSVRNGASLKLFDQKVIEGFLAVPGVFGLVADGLVIAILIVKTGATAMQKGPQGRLNGFVAVRWIHDHESIVAAEATAVGIIAIEIKIKVEAERGLVLLAGECACRQ